MMTKRNEIWIGVAAVIGIIPEFISLKMMGKYGFFFLYQNFFFYSLLLFLGLFSATVYLSYKMFSRSNEKELLHPFYYLVVFFGVLSFSFVMIPGILHGITSEKVQIFATVKPGFYWHKYEYGKIEVKIGPKDNEQFEFLDGEVLHGIRKEQFDELRAGHKVTIYGTLSAYAFHYLYVVPVNEEYMHNKINQSRNHP